MGSERTFLRSLRSPLKLVAIQWKARPQASRQQRVAERRGIWAWECQSRAGRQAFEPITSVKERRMSLSGRALAYLYTLNFQS
jgi:hypothetical protein